MEFYLFEELDFHLIVHHPYRALLAISGSVGKAALLRADKAAGVGLGLGIPGLNETSFGSGNGGGVDLEMASATAAAAGLDEEQAKAWEADRAALTRGDDGQPLARLEELEEAALQFAWFVLNDTYRTDISLLYPPHLIAIAALYLGLLLHPTSRQRMSKSVQLMASRRDKWRHACEEHAVRSAAAGQAHAAAASGSRRAGNGVPPGGGSAQSPQYAYTPSASHASPAPGSSSLRGLASLPMRPAHLPVRPGGVAATSTPSTPFPQQHGAGTTPRSAGGAAYSLDSPGASSAVSTPPDSSAMPSGAPAPAELPRVAPLPPPPAPPPDALTFLAGLNVDIRQIAEIVQDILGMYELWHRLDAPPAESESKPSGASAAAGPAFGATPAGGMISDGSGMLQRIERMRERRRTELLMLAAAGGGAIPNKPSTR
jgi:cyclin C